jgi:hypothetical protein
MNKIDLNPCIACGKERIISKMWKETIITFSGTKQEIEHIEAVCPDGDCQDMLNQDFANQKLKRDKIAQDREKRLKDNQAKKSGLRIAKKESKN